jgi:hypothetical protein
VLGFYFSPTTTHCSFAVMICQCLEARDNVEEFCIDGGLAFLVEGRLKHFKKVIDISLGSLHRGQAARVFARKRLGACLEQGYEEIFADQCEDDGFSISHYLWQQFCWPFYPAQSALPFLVQGKQPLLYRLVTGPGSRSALPPRSSGVSTSMILMPVSKISEFVERRANGGGWAIDRAPFDSGYLPLAIDDSSENIKHS